MPVCIGKFRVIVVCVFPELCIHNNITSSYWKFIVEYDDDVVSVGHNALYVYAYSFRNLHLSYLLGKWSTLIKIYA